MDVDQGCRFNPETGLYGRVGEGSLMGGQEQCTERRRQQLGSIGLAAKASVGQQEQTLALLVSVAFFYNL